MTDNKLYLAVSIAWLINAVSLVGSNYEVLKNNNPEGLVALLFLNFVFSFINFLILIFVNAENSQKI